MAMSVLDDSQRAYHRTWWALMLNGLLALAVGILIAVRPLDSVAAFALVIALWALFTGFVDIVRALELRAALKNWWLFLIAGLVAVGFGILAMVDYPILSLAFAVAFVSWWLLLIGLLELYKSHRLRRSGLHWSWHAVFGTVCIAAALVALIVPSLTLTAMMGLIALVGIISGIALIAGAVVLRLAVHGETPVVSYTRRATSRR